MKNELKKNNILLTQWISFVEETTHTKLDIPESADLTEHVNISFQALEAAHQPLPLLALGKFVRAVLLKAYQEPLSTLFMDVITYRNTVDQASSLAIQVDQLILSTLSEVDFLKDVDVFRQENYYSLTYKKTVCNSFNDSTLQTILTYFSKAHRVSEINFLNIPYEKHADFYNAILDNQTRKTALRFNGSCLTDACIETVSHKIIANRSIIGLQIICNLNLTLASQPILQQLILNAPHLIELQLCRYDDNTFRNLEQLYFRLHHLLQSCYDIDAIIEATPAQYDTLLNLCRVFSHLENGLHTLLTKPKAEQPEAYLELRTGKEKLAEIKHQLLPEWHFLHVVYKQFKHYAEALLPTSLIDNQLVNYHALFCDYTRLCRLLTERHYAIAAKSANPYQSQLIMMGPAIYDHPSIALFIEKIGFQIQVSVQRLNKITEPLTHDTYKLLAAATTALCYQTMNIIRGLDVTHKLLHQVLPQVQMRLIKENTSITRDNYYSYAIFAGLLEIHGPANNPTRRENDLSKQSFDKLCDLIKNISHVPYQLYMIETLSFLYPAYDAKSSLTHVNTLRQLKQHVRERPHHSNLDSYIETLLNIKTHDYKLMNHLFELQQHHDCKSHLLAITIVHALVIPYIDQLRALSIDPATTFRNVAEHNHVAIESMKMVLSLQEKQLDAQLTPQKLTALLKQEGIRQASTRSESFIATMKLLTEKQKILRQQIAYYEAKAHIIECTKKGEILLPAGEMVHFRKTDHNSNNMQTLRLLKQAFSKTTEWVTTLNALPLKQASLPKIEDSPKMNPRKAEKKQDNKPKQRPTSRPQGKHATPAKKIPPKPKVQPNAWIHVSSLVYQSKCVTSSQSLSSATPTPIATPVPSRTSSPDAVAVEIETRTDSAPPPVITAPIYTPYLPTTLYSPYDEKFVAPHLTHPANNLLGRIRFRHVLPDYFPCTQPELEHIYQNMSTILQLQPHVIMNELRLALASPQWLGILQDWLAFNVFVHVIPWYQQHMTNENLASTYATIFQDAVNTHHQSALTTPDQRLMFFLPRLFHTMLLNKADFSVKDINDLLDTTPLYTRLSYKDKHTILTLSSDWPKQTLSTHHATLYARPAQENIAHVAQYRPT